LTEENKKKPTTKGNSKKKGRIPTMPEQSKSLTTSAKPTSPARLKLVPPADIFNQMQQLTDSIARRAFEFFENNGRMFGRDLDDWFRAESELLHPLHIDMAESDGDLTVRAEVPGFTAKELEVSVEPRRLTITGKRETKEERKGEKTIYTERCSDQVLRVVDLPETVDADKTSATLKDGVLELTMPKAAPAKKIQIESKTA
jgi:HSP20 family protein